MRVSPRQRHGLKFIGRRRSVQLLHAHRERLTQVLAAKMRALRPKRKVRLRDGMRVAFFVHPHRRDGYEVARRAVSWLSERGHEGIVPQDRAGTWSELRDDFSRALEDQVDLAVSLGGDGTMLRTVELSIEASVPVLGVNMGTLGYLTEVPTDGLEAALERFSTGEYEIEERMTLEVEVVRGSSDVDEGSNERSIGDEGFGRARAPLASHRNLVLNEAVVEKTFPGRTVRMDVSIDGTPFVTYAADGLIVATPTGSTAYNLSVRGPIVSPRMSAVIVTPVSPHMLFDRSLVLEPSEGIMIKLVDGRRAGLVLDGFPLLELSPGDCVSCHAGSKRARLVTFHRRDFHAILKAKFALSGE